MKIYTITLNPAYDIHADMDQLALYHENLAWVTSREAGGKGVNLSRALKSGGTENTAVIVLGTENCADFKAQLEASGLDTRFLEKPGRIRENLTLHCANAPETRISFSGFPAEDSILQEVGALLQVEQDTIVTFTGRVASGMSMEKVKAFLKDLAARGARIVLDSKSFCLQDILELQPWLIKPNEEEIAAYLNCPEVTFETVRENARIFCRHGVANVMVSLGGQGALLLHGGMCWIAVPPSVKAVSTIGAGDSSLAGFIAGVEKDMAPADCLKNAVAYGTAACLTAGSQPPCPEDVAWIRSRTQVRVLE